MSKMTRKLACMYMQAKLAKTFKLEIGDPVLAGKYKNQKGYITGFSKDDKGQDTVSIEIALASGKTKKKTTQLFKIRFDDTRDRRKMASGIQGLKQRLMDKYHLSKFWIYGQDGDIIVSNITVDPEYRGQGNGQKAMQELLVFADRSSSIVALTPSSDFGSSKSRLTAWYRSLGFVPNKGRNKDFRFSETMIRFPNKGPKTATRPIPLDKGTLLKVAKDAAQAVLKTCEAETKRRRGAWNYKKLGAFRTGHGFFLQLPDIPMGKVLRKGEGIVPSQAKVPFYIQADKDDKATPSRRKIVRKAEWSSVGDTQWLRVYLYSSLTSARIEAGLADLEKELFSVLIHEMTHGVDLFDQPGEEVSQTHGLAPKDYVNNPLEFRAFLQQIADETLEGTKRGLSFDEALKGSTTFERVGPHLTLRNRKTMIKGVWTHWQDSLTAGEVVIEQKRAGKAATQQHVWHATRGSFRSFNHDKSGLGTHFGTQLAAGGRVLSKKGPGWSLKPYILSVSKPLRLPDVGGWDDEPQIESALIGAGVIPPEALIESRRLSGSSFWKWARTKIESAGFDSVVYRNRLEDPGQDSWIIWHDRQIKSNKAVERIASKFQNKKKVKKQDGGEMTVYEYSDGQIQHRNREKAKRIEKLRGSIEKLRSQVKKDLKVGL